MTVGFRRGLARDAARPDWDGTGPRPIAWAAWYPAGGEGVPVVAGEGERGAAFFRRLDVAADAPLRAGSWPVVLLSHGTGGSALQMDWLAHRLARRGFVALAPDHHGNTSAEPLRPEGFLCWWERARDLSVLLDHALAAEDLAGRLDPGRVFVAGFSLGGHTALSLLGAVTDMDMFRAWAGEAGLRAGPRAFPAVGERIAALMAGSAVFRASWARHADGYRDARVRAGLLLAPAPPVRAFTEASLRAVAAPVHIAAGGADEDAPMATGALWLEERLARCTVTVVAPQAGHAVFLPEGTAAGRAGVPDLVGDPPGVDRAAIHDAVAEAAAALFAAPAA